MPKQLIKLLTIMIISLLVAGFGCNSNQYSIEIRHFAGAAGITIYYLVDESSIKVDTDCDLANCKRKNVYTRNLTPSESDSLLNVLMRLRLDTLKALYTPGGMISDGLESFITLRGKIGNKKITFNNINLPVTDSLYKIVDNLIVTRKYQFHHFGEE